MLSYPNVSFLFPEDWIMWRNRPGCQQCQTLRSCGNSKASSVPRVAWARERIKLFIVCMLFRRSTGNPGDNRAQGGCQQKWTIGFLL